MHLSIELYFVASDNAYIYIYMKKIYIYTLSTSHF
jgi:hypothetical protein